MIQNKNQQPTLFDLIENPLVPRISMIIECHKERQLLAAVAKAVDNFRAIPKNQTYIRNYKQA